MVELLRSQASSPYQSSSTTTVDSINALGVAEQQSNSYGFSWLIFGLGSGILLSLVVGVAMSVLTGVVCFIRGKRKVKTDISMEEATDGLTLISMKSLRGTNPFVKETTFTSFRAADTSCKEVELEEDGRDQATDSAEKQQFLVKPHTSPRRERAHPEHVTAEIKAAEEMGETRVNSMAMQMPSQNEETITGVSKADSLDDLVVHNHDEKITQNAAPLEQCKMPEDSEEISNSNSQHPNTSSVSCSPSSLIPTIACSNENMHTAVSNPMYHSSEEFSDLEDDSNESESEK